MRTLITLCVVVLLHLTAFTQNKLNVKFGKVDMQDFATENKLDTGAGALILFDIGSTEFEGNNKGGFSLLFKRHTRIKILNKRGFEAANERILLYHNSNSEEVLEGLKGITYNIEGGKIVETKLDNNSVFKDVFNKNLNARKFTMPAVKEGCIIEYTYKIKSDFTFNLQPWVFQGEYPCLWSEYQTYIPEYFTYTSLSQINLPLFIKEENQKENTYYISLSNTADATQNFSAKGIEYSKRWVIKDIVPLKEGSFISTLDNYVSKIDFQLSSIRFPGQPIKDVMGNWNKMAKELMEDEDFGEQVGKNGWLVDDVKNIIGTEKDPLQKAKLIHRYITNNFTCSEQGKFTNGKTLKEIFKQKKGSVGGINLLLTSMLKAAQLQAYPMILSTKEHGYTNQYYPLLNKFNYTIAYLEIDSTSYFLDASKPKLGFNLLSPNCYNSTAQIILPEQAVPLELNANNIKEAKGTFVIISPNEKKDLNAQISCNHGTYESISLREKLLNETSKKDYIKELSKKFTNAAITNFIADSLNNYEEPVTTNYTTTLDKWEDDIIYFNPFLIEAWKDNPFKSEKRAYPIEMPYGINEFYTLNFTIPEGYKVEELPKNEKARLYEDEGLYQYFIRANNNVLEFSSRLVLPRANYEANEYEALRNFFAFIIKKNAQQVVFKKVK